MSNTNQIVMASLQSNIPAPVVVALDHVRSRFPDVTHVVYTREGRWLYMSDEGEMPVFNGSLDVGILEDACDAVESLPAVFCVGDDRRLQGADKPGVAHTQPGEAGQQEVALVVVELNGNVVKRVCSDRPARVFVLDEDTEGGDSERILDINDKEAYVTQRVLLEVFDGQAEAEGINISYCEGVQRQVDEQWGAPVL
jgi:hypothetical protein